MDVYIPKHIIYTCQHFPGHWRMHDSYPGSGRDSEEDPSTSEDVRRSLRTSRRFTTAFRTFPVVPWPILFTSLKTKQLGKYTVIYKNLIFSLYTYFSSVCWLRMQRPPHTSQFFVGRQKIFICRLVCREF